MNFQASCTLGPSPARRSASLLVPRQEAEATLATSATSWSQAGSWDRGWGFEIQWVFEALTSRQCQAALRMEAPGAPGCGTMSLKIVRKSLHPWTLGDLKHVSYRSPGVEWGQGIRDVGNEAPWSHLRNSEVPGSIEILQALSVASWHKRFLMIFKGHQFYLWWFPMSDSNSCQSALNHKNYQFHLLASYYQSHWKTWISLVICLIHFKLKAQQFHLPDLGQAPGCGSGLDPKVNENRLLSRLKQLEFMDELLFPENK